jgi:hypothetical protein
MADQMTIKDFLPEAKLKRLEAQYPIPRHKKKDLIEEGWTDDWHYAEIETPEESDVYYGITLWGSQESYNYEYIAWESKKKTWYFWDPWEKVWRSKSNRNVLAWVVIPSLYRKQDKSLHERLGLRGII